MITARYCGAESHTKSGTPLHWANNRNWRFHSPVSSSRVGPVEALWSERGAECIGHTRSYTNKEEALAIEKLREQCGLPRCDDAEKGERKGRFFWRSNAVDHADAVRVPRPRPVPPGRR